MDFEYRESRDGLDISCVDPNSFPFYENEVTKGIHSIIEHALTHYSSQNNFRSFVNPSLETFRKQIQENEKRILCVFGPQNYDPTAEYCLSDEEGIGEKKKNRRGKRLTSSSRLSKGIVTRTPLGMKNQKGFIRFNQNEESTRHKLTRIRRTHKITKPHPQRRSLSSYHTSKRNKILKNRKKDMLSRSQNRRPNSTHDLFTVRRNSLPVNVRTRKKSTARSVSTDRRRASSPGGVKLRSISNSKVNRHFVRGRRGGTTKNSTSSTKGGGNISSPQAHQQKGRIVSSPLSGKLQQITFPADSKKKKTSTTKTIVKKVFVKRRSAWGRNSISSFDKGYISKLRKEIVKKNKRRKKVLSELKREKVVLQRRLNSFKKSNQHQRGGKKLDVLTTKKKKVVIPKAIKSDYDRYLEIKKKIKNLDGLGKFVASKRK